MGRLALLAHVRKNVATVTLRPKLLWAAGAAGWGGTAAACAANLPENMYTLTLGVALITTLAAVQATAMTTRLDRQYAAMVRAFSQQHDGGNLPAERVVVPFQRRDTSQL